MRPRSSSRTSNTGTELVEKLILASGSPQRRAILEQLGVACEVVVSGAAELESGPPEEVVLENAHRKATAVAGELGQRRRGAVILGVDTIVALGGQVYGKPADEVEAEATLRLLSGHTHRVLSGVCVIDRDGARTRTAAAVTAVSFRRLEPELLAWYLATGEWRERAGGYAVQLRGAALVERIEGDYLNVVGLPVPTLMDLVTDLLQ